MSANNLGKYLHPAKARPADEAEPIDNAQEEAPEQPGVGDRWKRLQAAAKKPTKPGAAPMLREPPKTFPGGKVRG